MLHDDKKPNKTAEELFQQALGYQQQDLNEQAQQAVIQALNTPPQDPALCVKIGCFLESRGKLVEAKIAYERAIGMDPTREDAHGLLGAVLLRVGERETAQCVLNTWASLTKDPVASRLRLTSLLMRLGEFEFARDLLEVVVDLDPKQHEAYRCLGEILSCLGDTEGSIAAFERGRRLVPNDRKTALSLGVALSQAGRHEEAVQVLAPVVDGSSESSKALLSLGRSHRETGDLETAVKILETARDSDASVSNAHLELGQTYRLLGHSHKAKQALEQAASLAPNSGEAHYQLGLILLEAGDIERAKRELACASVLMPNDAMVSQAHNRLQSYRAPTDNPLDVCVSDASADIIQDAQFTGKLEAFPVTNLVEFLSHNRSTGTLLIASNTSEIRVHFLVGNISSVFMTGRPSLGEWLVTEGRLTLEQYTNIPDETKEKDQAGLAHWVVEQGLIREDDARRSLSDHVIEILTDVMQWTEGGFAFQRDQATRTASHEIALDPRFILLEIMRIIDEKRT